MFFTVFLCVLNGFAFFFVALALSESVGRWAQIAPAAAATASSAAAVAAASTLLLEPVFLRELRLLALALYRHDCSSTIS